MSSPARGLPALCHLNYCEEETDAATKSYFYTDSWLANWSPDSYRFTVLEEIAVAGFYKKCDSIFSICFIV